MSEIVSHRSDSFIIRIFILHPGNYIRIHISETTIPFPKLISHNSNTLSLGQDGTTGRGLLQRSSRAIRRLVLYPFFIYPIYIDNVKDGRQIHGTIDLKNTRTLWFRNPKRNSLFIFQFIIYNKLNS